MLEGYFIFILQEFIKPGLIFVGIIGLGVVAGLIARFLLKRG